MNEVILAIDQGTTGTTAMLVDRNLHVLGKATIEFAQIFPQPGWVEHNPEVLWQSVLGAIQQVLHDTALHPSHITALGLTNQRETCLLWDRTTLKPLHHAIVWQDRRTATFCDQLKQNHEHMIREKTGLVCDPYFSASKVAWLLDNIPDAYEHAQHGELAFGTIETFLLAKLTGGKAHLTDVTNASRTMLMNLHTRNWDNELLELFEIPKEILPRIVSNAELAGVTQNVPGLPDGIPITGFAGDQQAALIGQACFTAGEAKCTYGTGSFILMNIGERPKLSQAGCLTTVAYQIGKNLAYAFEGSSFIAGAMVQWLRDGLGMIKHASEIEALANSAPDSAGVVVVPALAGLGCPHWNANARGQISGLTRGSTKAHIARATLEGIALSQYDILQAMQRDLNSPLQNVKVDGGAAANNLLMQIQADLLQVALTRPQTLETTAFGAACLAGLGVGLWKNLDEIKKVWQAERTFQPAEFPHELVKQWNTALEKV